MQVFIVDDNRDEDLAPREWIREKIRKLRSQHNLKESSFKTHYELNTRTRGHSGTGCWNTGAYLASRIPDIEWIAFLDDDDEYLPNHLSDCIGALELNPIADAVFQQMNWYWESGKTIIQSLNKKDLTPNAFFIGNPGIQGSNMFFRLTNFLELGGFDEAFPNTTDREFMIRFLNLMQMKYGKEYLNFINVIPREGVKHYVHQKASVNFNVQEKKRGLDLFYKKFKARFSDEEYRESLERAAQLFHYYPNR